MVTQAMPGQGLAKCISSSAVCAAINSQQMPCNRHASQPGLTAAKGAVHQAHRRRPLCSPCRGGPRRLAGTAPAAAAAAARVAPAGHMLHHLCLLLIQLELLADARRLHEWALHQPIRCRRCCSSSLCILLIRAAVAGAVRLSSSRRFMQLPPAHASRSGSQRRRGPRQACAAPGTQ